MYKYFKRKWKVVYPFPLKSEPFFYQSIFRNVFPRVLECQSQDFEQYFIQLVQYFLDKNIAYQNTLAAFW